MHYVDEGAGHPVVCVHGNPSWSYYFRSVVAACRGDHRVVAMDHIGCGLSDKPGDEVYKYTLASRVDDLEALLDHLGIRENITLVLHDWGGMIGMSYAVRHPERIARIVVMNTAAFLLPATKRFPLALWIVRNTPLGPLLVQGLNMFARSAARVCVKRKPLPPKVRAAYLAPYDSWKNRIATLRFVQDIPLKPGDAAYTMAKHTEDQLTLFAETPLLVCWGSQDFVFSDAFYHEWLRRLPHAETLHLPDAGHYLLEDASEDVVPRIRRFLSEHPITATVAAAEAEV